MVFWGILWFLVFALCTYIFVKKEWHLSDEIFTGEVLQDCLDEDVNLSSSLGILFIWLVNVFCILIISGILLGLWFLTVPSVIAVLLIYKVRKFKLNKNENN